MNGPREIASAAFRQLLDGQPLNGTPPEACGEYADKVQGMEEARATGGIEGARRYWGHIVQVNPDLASLISGDRRRYEYFWLKDAMQPQDPDKYIIGGVVLEGSVNLVAGEPGSKKTWLVLDMLLAVAMGVDWIGKPTIKGTALVIDEESGERRLAKRIAALARARHAAHDTQLAYVSLARFDFRNTEDVQAVKDLILETGASIVAIDAMVDVMLGADENSVQDVQPVMAALRKLAEETRAAIILIHHVNRAGSYRGSSAISGAVDLMLKVESKSDSPTIEITTEKARDVEPFKMAAHIRFEDEKIYLDEAEIEERTQPLNTGEQYVMEYLQNHGESSIKDIEESPEREACSARTARNAVFSLAKRKKIRRVDNGGPGEKAVYDIKRDIPPPDYEDRLPYKDDP